MGRIPDELIAEIRERVDIVSVLGEHMQLKKAGASWKGLCPFHGEKTPSFNVSPAKRAYYCFGCQRHGDVFKFLMELQGKSFVEVAKELAARCGVIIPERPATPEEERARSERGRLFDVNATVTAWLVEQLRGPAGEKGRRYLASRGIGEAVADGFRLGLAPDAWDELANHLSQKKVPVAAAMQLGLVAPRRSGQGYYDKFRDRLMCPVILPGGEVAGFSGRTLGTDKETPKYVNSPESPVYKKSHLLFGLHLAREGFRRAGRALLVEGNFDVIALHQAGFTEAVAPLGTALTEQQVEQLRRLTDKVVLCMDGDKAGRAATLKDIVLLTRMGVNPMIAELPQGEDPDTFVRKHGREALEKLLAGAQECVRYFVTAKWMASDRSAGSLNEALMAIAPILAAEPVENKRLIEIDQAAKALGIDPRIVNRAVVRGAQAVAQPAERPRPVQAGPLPPSIELKVLAILADHPELLPVAETLEIRSLLTDGRLRDMYSAAHAGSPMLSAAPPEISDIVAKEVMAGSYASLEDPRRTLENALMQLRRTRLEAEIVELRKQVKDAERRGETALVRELVLKQHALERSTVTTTKN